MIQTGNNDPADQALPLKGAREAMIRANMNWLTRLNNKQRAWLAAGIVGVGLVSMNNEQRGARVSPVGGNAPAAGVSDGRGDAVAAGQDTSPGGWNGPVGGDETGIPQNGGTVPQSSGSVPAAAPTSDTGAEVPTSGDSVSDRVNTNFDDTIRGQQRVISENDGQTYITDANADPNQMTDTRDSVSGFSAATPGSDAAGTAAVAPSGATTVDTSTATPVETSSAATPE
jgi:hypothetical protein